MPQVLTNLQPKRVPIVHPESVRGQPEHAQVLSLKSQLVISSAPADEIDTQFIELFSMFETLMVFSRDPSDASCVVTATVGSSSLTSSSGRADR